MAKRNKAYREKVDLTKFCAFWGMAIAAILYICSGVLNLIIRFVGSISSETAGVLSQAVSIITLLGNIAIIIAIGLPAYGFVRGKSKGWKIFYWVALVIFALGVVFGMISTVF
ncbi:MAG: hypothetical protein K2J83_03535 [Clostridia bacterium]|nr:hypothetical protein [Clostridia bacterium]MDE7265460.1 hypothetical protein [Clostridia bacterium]